MILHDFAQALSDLGLVLFLTVLLLAALFIAGRWLNERALKQQMKADRIARHADNPKSQEQAARLTNTASFVQGISTELFGAVITTLAFGVVLLVFQQYQSIQNHKAELILQMGSPDNAFAVEAARQLQALGWLTDGTLQGADLDGANLQGVTLWDANLQGAFLWGTNFQGATLENAIFQGATLENANLEGSRLLSANLQGAHLRSANLEGANLSGANLEGAHLLDANLQSAKLYGAKFQGADLEVANLQGVDLGYANMQGANLQGANLQDGHLGYANLQDANLRSADLQSAHLMGVNLQGADLTGVIFSEHTVLPDGEWDPDNRQYKSGSYWTPDTDMTRYTDPNHPDFWQPEWVKEQSP